ncbi:Calponiny [Gracilaria domingensis]|nr:Calponiny [Gracilaria domingensis]
MMAGAYFVGRHQLLRWINELTGLNYSKIEQTASGVFACHVFDALFPGMVRLEKVKFNAKHAHEYIHNYKILQNAFNRAKLRKRIDVEKLVKAKYQDNLEFMQWIKAFYDAHASEEALNYDGRLRREEITGRSGTSPVARSARPALAANRPRTHENGASRGLNGSRAVASAMVKRSEFNALKEENDKLRAEVDNCETDREFYFNKLRDVEIIIQSVDDKAKKGEDEKLDFLSVFEEIKAVLYADEAEAPVADDELRDDPRDSLADEAEHLSLDDRFDESIEEQHL